MSRRRAGRRIGTSCARCCRRTTPAAGWWGARRTHACTCAAGARSRARAQRFYRTAAHAPTTPCSVQAYMKDPKTPLGRIVLNSYFCAKTEDSSNYEFTVNAYPKSLVLRAHSKADMEEWIGAMMSPLQVRTGVARRPPRGGRGPAVAAAAARPPPEPPARASVGPLGCLAAPSGHGPQCRRAELGAARGRLWWGSAGAEPATWRAGRVQRRRGAQPRPGCAAALGSAAAASPPPLHTAPSPSRHRPCRTWPRCQNRPRARDAAGGPMVGPGCTVPNNAARWPWGAPTSAGRATPTGGRAGAPASVLPTWVPCRGSLPAPHRARAWRARTPTRGAELRRVSAHVAARSVLRVLRAGNPGARSEVPRRAGPRAVTASGPRPVGVQRARAAWGR